MNQGFLIAMLKYFIPFCGVGFEDAGYLEFEDDLDWFLVFVEAFFFALTNKMVSFATVLMLE